MSRVSSEDIESDSMFDLNYVILSVLVLLLILKFKSRYS